MIPLIRCKDCKYWDINLGYVSDPDNVALGICRKHKPPFNFQLSGSGTNPKHFRMIHESGYLITKYKDYCNEPVLKDNQ